MKTKIAILGTMLLSGCAAAPSSQELVNADYGERPQNYVQTIHEYFDASLKDPSSVVYHDITAPEHDWIRDAPIAGYQMHYGWKVFATINAKNSYGGYTGFQTYRFLFRGEQLDKIITPDTPLR